MTKALMLFTLLGALPTGLFGASYNYVKVAEAKLTTTSVVVGVGLSSNGIVLLDVLDGTSDTLYTSVDGTQKKVFDLSLANITMNSGAINAKGDIAVEADSYPRKADAAIYSLNNGVLTKIADSSRSAMPYINDNGDISFVDLPGSVYDGVKLIVRTGQKITTLATTGSGQFHDLSTFLGGPINNSGQASLAASNGDCEGGQYTFQNGTPTVAVPYSLIGLCVGSSPWLNDNGALAFSALDFQRRTYSIYLKDKDGLRTIVEGDGRSQFGTVNVNNSGRIVYYSVAGSSPGIGGLYSGPDVTRDKVVAEGDALFGSTITKIVVPFINMRYLDEQGRILFTYLLEDGRVGTALAVPVASTAPVVAAGGVVPIFGSAPIVQSGSWVSIYGTNLSNDTVIWNGDFPTSLGGVSVTINGKACYLWLVSPTQINLQVPDDTTTGVVDVVITTPFGSTKSSVTMAPRSPAFSLLDGRYPAVVIPTPDGKGAYGGGSYDLAGPAGYFAFNTRPIRAGEVVTLYGVGFGPTSPTVPAGAPFSGAAPTIIPVVVVIGGLDAKVLFSGLTGAGLYQINVVVPAELHGDQELRASISGAFTQPNLYLSVQ